MTHLGLARLGAVVCLGVLFGCATAGRRATNSPAERVWLANEWTAVGAGDLPEQDGPDYSSAARTLRIDAAQNETVAFQIVLPPASSSVGRARLQMGDFSGPAAMRAADVVRIFEARYVRVTEFPSWYREHTGRSTRPADIPDALVPAMGRHFAENIQPDTTRNQILWVDVAVPGNAPAGDYSARIQVERPSGAPVFDGTLQLRVLPIQLPGSSSLPVLARFDPKALLQQELDWPAELGPVRLNPRLPEHAPLVHLASDGMTLLHESGLDPILWAAFPKYEDANDGAVQIDWSTFDAAITPYITGEAYADRRAPRFWPIPASRDQPDADRYGGFESGRYSRALASYLAQCEEHFRSRGWEKQAFVRILPPAPLNASTEKAIARASRIVQQSEIAVPLAAHLPASSLRSLGWHNAPQGTQAPVQIWISPGMWLQPGAVEERAQADEQSWLMPDAPPYSGSLTVATAHTDPIVIPWLAFRYGLNAVWIEDAGALPPAANNPPPDWTGLLYPGTEFGAARQVLPSLRLKRLRRGIQDIKILNLLAQRGKPLLASTSSRQLVKWGLTEAALDNLLARRAAGWPVEGEPYRLARRVALQELGAKFDESPVAPSTTTQPQASHPTADGAEWERILSTDPGVHLEVRGVRLVETDDGLRGMVFVGVHNSTSRPISGVWTLPNPPRGWRLERAVPIEAGPGERKLSALQLAVDAFTFDEDGVYLFELLFETRDAVAAASETVSARFALTASPMREQPPRIDARLDDWQVAGNNTAGDFRLVRPGRSASNRPTNPTQVFFSMDAENLYVAVRCVQSDEPTFRNNNEIQVQAGIPWGEDIVEVLLDPRGVPDGTSGDIYCLQVKPNGLLIARKGCFTDPPMGPSELWPSNARVAAAREPNGWVMEMAIPLESFARAGQNNLWGCNVTRLDAGNGEYSSWSGAQATCYLPRSLGNLVLMRP